MLVFGPPFPPSELITNFEIENYCGHEMCASLTHETKEAFGFVVSFMSCYIY